MAVSMSAAYVVDFRKWCVSKSTAHFKKLSTGLYGSALRASKSANALDKKGVRPTLSNRRIKSWCAFPKAAARCHCHGKQAPLNRERRHDMSTHMYSVDELISTADKTKQPVDQLVRTIKCLEEIDNKRQASRRANDEDKAAITDYLKTLDGHLTSDLPKSEILAGANVRHNQGTSAFAGREVKRLLLLRDLRGVN